MQAEIQKPTISDQPFTSEEIAEILRLLASEYHTTLPNLLRRLDNVSGSLSDLDKVFNGDSCVEWTKEEDELLNKNADLLIRWKGPDAVNRRKKYNAKKWVINDRFIRIAWFLNLRFFLMAHNDNEMCLFGSQMMNILCRWNRSKSMINYELCE